MDNDTKREMEKTSSSPSLGRPASFHAEFARLSYPEEREAEKNKTIRLGTERERERERERETVCNCSRSSSSAGEMICGR